MKRLTDDDRALWSAVARSVERRRAAKAFTQAPLPDSRLGARSQAQSDTKRSDPSRIPAPPPKPRRPSAPVRAPLPVPPPKATGAGRLDTKDLRRIARGRTPIEGRLDLHGMTREAARGRLLDFLAMSRATGRRTVLVITGKGSAGPGKGGGVLRREVPLWLATAPFAPLVGAVEEARREHGGEGALYVRLRK